MFQFATVKLRVGIFTPLAEMTNFSNIYSSLQSTAGKFCAKDHISSAHGLKGVTDLCLPVAMAFPCGK